MLRYPHDPNEIPLKSNHELMRLFSEVEREIINQESILACYDLIKSNSRQRFLGELEKVKKLKQIISSIGTCFYCR
jgi:hypothetical protein